MIRLEHHLQILSKCEYVDTRVLEVQHRLHHLLRRLTKPKHDRGLGVDAALLGSS